MGTNKEYTSIKIEDSYVVEILNSNTKFSKKDAILENNTNNKNNNNKEAKLSSYLNINSFSRIIKKLIYYLKYIFNLRNLKVKLFYNSYVISSNYI